MSRNNGPSFYKKPAGNWIDSSCCQIARYPEGVPEDPECLLAAVSELCVCIFPKICMI